MVILGQINFSSDTKTVLFYWKFHVVLIIEGEIFKWHRNCLIFEKITPRNNGCSSNFQMTSLHLGYFQVWTGQFKFHAVQLYFWESLTRDNKRSSNYQITSTKLPSFWERFWEQARLSNHINKTAFFLRKFYLLIIATVQIFKWLY